MKKTMKKIDKDDLKQLLQAIHQFKKETKDAAVDTATSRLSTKDILFYFLAQNAALENRVTIIETTQKLSLWFAGIALTAISIGIGIFKL